MRVPLLTAIIMAISLCNGQPLNRNQARQRVRSLMALGRLLFSDPRLSASSKLSCASCHDPRSAYGPPNDLAVQFGGKDLRQMGHRAVPSLRYLQSLPQFTEHYFEADTTGEDSADNGPTGGFTWDGRVDRGRDQARIPLLSPFEMGNENPQEVVTRALRTDAASELKRLSRGSLFDTVLEAIEAFEQDEREFYPYTSKYDAWLAGRASLTRTELEGLELFKNPAKGNCARCHPADLGANGTPPQFTDYAFVALGVPRNTAIPANADAQWFDLGLCGPDRKDMNRVEYCGKFRTPTLRNVARRKVFFHNGVFHDIRDAVAFYVRRDTEASQSRFDDLPRRFWANVETNAPFGQETATLTREEIDAIVEFLRTLSDLQ